MRIARLILIFTISTPAAAQEDCVKIGDDAVRLSCYDRAFGRQDLDQSQSSSSEEVLSASTSDEISPALLDALSKRSAVHLIEAVESSDSLDGLQDKMRIEAINIILNYVRPLPASNAEANRDGYSALAALDPSDPTFKQKANRYAAAVEEKRTSILRRMKKETDEFNGNVFYEHPNTPRYTDTRSYLAVYAGQNSGRVWLRMRLNYTNDSWLFVQNAALNIDGETVRLPYMDWKRDNDSEIWEWIDVTVDADLRSTLEKIAASKSTIVRFNGRQYYDNVTIREADKQVIRDMFLVEEILKSESG
ncbi:hypothetical protein PXK01_02555 [Phaeobacter sp. PT47_59]|uniref:hypothetical protein n=1 Tax=Phaeobacter sp. PT47_59 TaxID=3029979 RepID=UPI002380AD23|nr:hypothetical protein [Phaeobacter sp. PT47_59]MDE4173015.1 hypothetical protein [Phaeobacter sp. PT47_59]